VERNRISSLHSHGKTLEKESYYYYYYFFTKNFFIPQVVKIPGVKNYKTIIIIISASLLLASKR